MELQGLGSDPMCAGSKAQAIRFPTFFSYTPQISQYKLFKMPIFKCK